MRPICTVCNQRPRAIAYHRGEKTYYRSRCGACIRKNLKLPAQTPRWELNGYKKKPACDCCGFRARYSAQLRVFHVDGNLNNTAAPNLKTVCLNCHVEIEKADLPGRIGDLRPDV